MKIDQLVTLFLLVLAAGGAAIVAVDPETLGLPAVVRGWVGVGMAMDAAALAFMRRLWPRDFE